VDDRCERDASLHQDVARLQDQVTTEIKTAKPRR
jgi:hypothetical protein